MGKGGLYNKYLVNKNNGNTDPEADYFVMRVDSDDYARQAVLFYAQLVEKVNPALAKDLRNRVEKYEGDCTLHLPTAYDDNDEKFLVLSEIQYSLYGNISKIAVIDEDGCPITYNKGEFELNCEDYF